MLAGPYDDAGVALLRRHVPDGGQCFGRAVDDQWPPGHAAARFRVSPSTAKRWADRYRESRSLSMTAYSGESANGRCSPTLA
ncbi:helix-turn-helix domain-containing protein [Streptomyces mirabilis]|uniref:helix-turn-helix domain-containing protein n=1 Tax=Streptomyces mirabilis TaxID=68239 RepID=UPI003688F39C